MEAELHKAKMASEQAEHLKAELKAAEFANNKLKEQIDYNNKVADELVKELDQEKTARKDINWSW
jgi:hypothetical protein